MVCGCDARRLLRVRVRVRVRIRVRVRVRVNTSDSFNAAACNPIKRNGYTLNLCAELVIISVCPFPFLSGLIKGRPPQLPYV